METVNHRIADIIRSESDRIYALALRIIGDRDAAQDVAQDAFIKVMKSYPRITNTGQLTALVIRTVYHLALNYRRDSNRRAEKHQVMKLDRETSLPTQASSDSYSLDPSLDIAIGQLAEKQQEVIRLRFFGQYKINEIAAALNITEGTVKVHLARGLANLKKSLISDAGKD